MSSDTSLANLSTDSLSWMPTRPGIQSRRTPTFRSNSTSRNLKLLIQSKAKQRCVMGIGISLYAQLVQTKNKQCKSAIILQCYHPHLSDFCSRLRLTQPYNHIIYPGVAKFYLVFLWKWLLCLLILLFLASCSIPLQFWVQKKIFLNHSDIYYLLILSCDL